MPHEKAMPKPRGMAHRARNVSMKELSDHFHLPINKVAAKLGVCVTVLKQRCREHGIYRWPYRKVQKLDTLISSLQTLVSPEDTKPAVGPVLEERKKRLDTAVETRTYLLLNPNSAAHLKFGKVKGSALRSARSHSANPGTSSPSHDKEKAPGQSGLSTCQSGSASGCGLSIQEDEAFTCHQEASKLASDISSPGMGSTVEYEVRQVDMAGERRHQVEEDLLGRLEANRSSRHGSSGAREFLEAGLDVAKNGRQQAFNCREGAVGATLAESDSGPLLGLSPGALHHAGGSFSSSSRSAFRPLGRHSSVTSSHISGGAALYSGCAAAHLSKWRGEEVSLPGPQVKLESGRKDSPPCLLLGLGTLCSQLQSPVILPAFADYAHPQAMGKKRARGIEQPLQLSQEQSLHSSATHVSASGVPQWYPVHSGSSGGSSGRYYPPLAHPYSYGPSLPTSYGEWLLYAQKYRAGIRS